MFSWTAETGVRLYAQFQHPTFHLDADGMGWESDDFYHLSWPSQSSAGDVIAFTGRSDCTNGMYCYSAERWQTTVRFADGTQRTFPGSAQLSANGNFALVLSSRPSGHAFRPSIALINMRTGQTADASDVDLAGYGSRQIADNGATLRYASPQQDVLQIWNPGLGPFQPTEIRSLPQLTRVFGRALLSSDANIVVAATAAGVVAYDVRAGRTELLSKDGRPVDMSDDGSTILIVGSSSGGWIVVKRGNPVFRVVAGLNDGVSEAVLSGNGKVIYAKGSKVLRITLDSSSVTEIVPKTTYAQLYWVDSTGGSVGRGSLMRLRNTRTRIRSMFVLEPLPGGPPDVGRYRNESWSVRSWLPQDVAVQVPWEAPARASANSPPDYVHVVTRPTSEGNPFEEGWIGPLIGVTEVAPVWLRDARDTATILSAHQDFRSLLSDSPA